MENEANHDNLPFPQTIGGPDLEGTDDNLPPEGDSSQDASQGENPEFAQLRADFEAQRNLVTSLLQSRTAQPEPAPEPEIQMPAFDDLPDPVERPEEYRQAVRDRMTQTAAAMERRIQRTITEATQQQRQAANVDRLWSTFRSTHGDLAKREMLAQAAAAAEFNALRARGVQDVLGAALSDERGFVDRIAARMRSELGMDAAPALARRTQGVAGGSRPAGGTPRQNGDKPIGFVQQLRKAQLDSGLI